MRGNIHPRFWRRRRSRSRWVKHVVLRSAKDEVTLCQPHYEPALLTTLNERLKSGDVTVSHSRRWTDFEEYLAPRSLWASKRVEHYANLELPLVADEYIEVGARARGLSVALRDGVLVNETRPRKMASAPR